MPKTMSRREFTALSNFINGKSDGIRRHFDVAEGRRLFIGKPARLSSTGRPFGVAKGAVRVEQGRMVGHNSGITTTVVAKVGGVWYRFRRASAAEQLVSFVGY